MGCGGRYYSSALHLILLLLPLVLLPLPLLLLLLQSPKYSLTHIICNYSMITITSSIAGSIIAIFFIVSSVAHGNPLNKSIVIAAVDLLLPMFFEAVVNWTYPETEGIKQSNIQVLDCYHNHHYHHHHFNHDHHFNLNHHYHRYYHHRYYHTLITINNIITTTIIIIKYITCSLL